MTTYKDSNYFDNLASTFSKNKSYQSRGGNAFNARNLRSVTEVSEDQDEVKTARRSESISTLTIPST